MRNLPNVLLVHFADLEADMPGEIARIAEFLGIAVGPDRWPAVLEHCSFEYMKRNAARSAPLGRIFWDGGAETFIHKGTNGRWREVLSAEESAKYERMASEALGYEAAYRLANGMRAHRLQVAREHLARSGTHRAGPIATTAHSRDLR